MKVHFLKSVQHKQNVEAKEILELAKEKLKQKEDSDFKSSSDFVKEVQQSELSERDRFIETEVKIVKKDLGSSVVKSFIADVVTVEIVATKWRKATMKIQFPQMYPQEELILDIKSDTLSPELLVKLQSVATAEGKKKIGERQVHNVISFVKSFLENNLLLVAFDDLQEIRRLFEGGEPELKSVKERSGVVHMILKEQEYFMEVRCTLPINYPEESLQIEILKSNFQSDIVPQFLLRVQDMARRCAEPPQVTSALTSVGREGAGSGPKKQGKRQGVQTFLSNRKEQELSRAAQESRAKALDRQQKINETFVSQSSLLVVVDYLLNDSLRPLAAGKCAICEKRLIPSDPQKLNKVPREMRVMRLYCGHLYHGKCVEEYVSKPPFGKECHHCGRKMEHHNLTTDVKVLEQRWAANQARNREINDVVDFMM
eukprot:TRINITY_DN5212_c0_g2_i1.p2 TRINITY_DN5212_c0_g2~~TRINITY_DN5212_c0_g2_i1.p2  ORF type:complete len:428 (-),score=48.45 TRINITY_DN5212_c0_g2_i1:603-1886(-)